VNRSGESDLTSPIAVTRIPICRKRSAYGTDTDTETETKRVTETETETATNDDTDAGRPLLGATRSQRGSHQNGPNVVVPRRKMNRLAVQRVRRIKRVPPALYSDARVLGKGHLCPQDVEKRSKGMRKGSQHDLVTETSNVDRLLSTTRDCFLTEL